MEVMCNCPACHSEALENLVQEVDSLSRPCRSAKSSVGVRPSVWSLRVNVLGILPDPEALRSRDMPDDCTVGKHVCMKGSTAKYLAKPTGVLYLIRI
jgi:hypothetical protein